MGKNISLATDVILFADKEQDDYAGMREAVARRLLYLDDKKREKEMSELEILPDLILLDGGKSHLNSVLNMAWDERNCHLPFGIKFGHVVKQQAQNKGEG